MLLRLAVLLWLGLTAPVGAATQPFDAWLRQLRTEAAGLGIRPQTLDRALAGVAPIDRVIELDRRQPEGTLTFQEYLDRVVPQARIDRARDNLRDNRALIEPIAQRHGVPARVIVALWGVESDFGRVMGNFSVVSALATLAYDGRRSSFFRKELFDALRILDQGHITPQQMLGSWAGAMGQSQFMPSSFLAYAVDEDGDGRRDIWTNRADVFGSIANYLRRSGWRREQTWGRAVRFDQALPAGTVGLEVKKPLAEWARLGVRRTDGRPLGAEAPEGSLVQPGGPGGPTFLVYENFRTILKWNRSNYFATAVGLLSDQVECAGDC